MTLLLPIQKFNIKMFNVAKTTGERDPKSASVFILKS